MRRGFLLGKFMPLHNGHLFLCEVAAGLVDELTVMVCTRDCEPIPGELRRAWAEAALPRHVRIRHLHRDVPQEPSEHPDFWAIWHGLIREVHPEPIDMVFGSEPYVHRLAEVMGAAPFLVDPRRREVPVSASAIRADPAAHWQHVPPAVRPYYQRRYCVIGPESAGKTTLCQRLAALWGTRVLPEYGREFDLHFRQGGGWIAADFPAIARGHDALAAAVGGRAGPVVFEDTDPLQTAVWAEFLLGQPVPELEALLARRLPPRLYLLLTPEVDWIDDGTRYSGDAARRQWFFDRCRARLEAGGFAWRVIGGCDWEQRLRDAIACVTGDMAA